MAFSQTSKETNKTATIQDRELDNAIRDIRNLSEQQSQDYSDIQEELDQKYDASNPNGYETPAQLNVRDTANRQRANHTGTQNRFTIYDFNDGITSYLQQPLKTYPRTYAQMIALIGLVGGEKVYCSTYASEFIYDTFFGWIPLGTMIPEIGYHWTDECIGLNSGYLTYGSSNGGGNSAPISNTGISPLRLFGLSTGTATNGEYRHGTNGCLLGSTGKKSYRTRVGVDALSTSTDRYVCKVGFINSLSGLALQTGMYFIYDEGGIYGTATASPNWLCVCCSSGGGGLTIVNSGVPVTISPTNALQKLSILDDGLGNNVRFYINDILVATITTNIPTTSITLSAGNAITKQAGTTARVSYEDFIDVKEVFNTAR